MTQRALPGTGGGADGRHGLVAVLFALYLVAHHVYLFGGIGTPLLAAGFLTAPALLLMRPNSIGLLLLNAVAHLGQTLWIAPIFSNHALMSLFLTAGFVLTWLLPALRDRRAAGDPGAYFGAYAPLGRWLLIGMYVYGTLHKINTDFLDPEVSCAVALWARYGFPAIIADSPVFHAAAMYGTLAIEASVIGMLLTARLRWWGILVGVAFHGFLGFLPPGNIHAYSLLAILLHATFLPPDALDAVRRTRTGAAVSRALAVPGAPVAASAAAVAGYLAAPGAVAWAVILAAAIGFIVLAGRERGPRAAGAAGLLRPGSPVVAVLAAAFFLNGLSPYLGFKTGQTIAMFSNLETAEGRTNHLFMPSLALFDHQSHIARDIETDEPALARWAGAGYDLVAFQVMDYLERDPGATATFTVNGRAYRHAPDAPIAAVAELPPRWVRQFLVFRPVDASPPRRCDSY